MPGSGAELLARAMAKERIRETRVIPERGITIECGALKEDWSGSV